MCYNIVKKVIKEVDILIIIGGVLVGDYDYLFVIYERLWVNVFFDKIVMWLGSVIIVVEVEGKLLFGLFGNFFVCYVGCELYVRLVIGKYLYREDLYIYCVEVIL